MLLVLRPAERVIDVLCGLRDEDDGGGAKMLLVAICCNSSVS